MHFSGSVKNQGKKRTGNEYKVSQYAAAGGHVCWGEHLHTCECCPIWVPTVSSLSVLVLTTLFAKVSKGL